MNRVVIWFSAGLLFSCTSPEANDSCIDESAIDPDAICTQIYAPVCGCDGITYGNSCVAESKGVTRWTEGECKEVIDSSAGQ